VVRTNGCYISLAAYMMQSGLIASSLIASGLQQRSSESPA
jgi:hypothetical protein